MTQRNEVCVQCGDHLGEQSRPAPPRKYCSALCRGRAQGAKRKRVKQEIESRCEQCDSLFTTLAYPGRAPRFCETKCYKRFHYLANAKLYQDRAAASAKRDPERRSAVSKAYREANRERISEAGKAWYAANRDAIASQHAAYYQAHKAERAAYWQRWYSENPDVAMANVKKWREANPERVREIKRLHTHRRRAMMLGGIYETFKASDVFERDGWVCQICDNHIMRSRSWPDPLTASLDHIVPLALGGGHTMDNTQCAHLRCNMLKSDRDDSGFSQRSRDVT